MIICQNYKRFTNLRNRWYSLLFGVAFRNVKLQRLVETLWHRWAVGVRTSCGPVFTTCRQAWLLEGICLGRFNTACQELSCLSDLPKCWADGCWLDLSVSVQSPGLHVNPSTATSLINPLAPNVCALPSQHLSYVCTCIPQLVLPSIYTCTTQWPVNDIWFLLSSQSLTCIIISILCPAHVW